MDDSTIQDLMGVYGNSLEPQLFQTFVDHLDADVSLHTRTLIIRTRNDTGSPLGYFSLVHASKSKPVIFAGAIEQNFEKRSVPAIRFMNSNPVLHQVPDEFEFEYRKPNLTNVQLSKDTINSLPDLFRSEINDYLRRHDLS